MGYTILVTGGAGFIGSHVVDDLLKMNCKVIVLDDLSGGFIENVDEKAIFIEGSITDEKLVKNIFSEYSLDFVFHIAAYAAEGLSHFIKKFNYENNLLGSVNLINASINHNIRCFIFTSSIAVYGKNQLPMSENMTPIPEDSYGIAKLAIEQELKNNKDLFNLNYIIFRPHNVYGERQNIGDKYRNVIGIFMNQIMQDMPLTIFGDGTQTRAFSYIRDVSPIIAKAPFVKKAYNQIFNIGADEIYSINELAEKVCEMMNSEIKKKTFDERKEVKHAYSSHKKACKILDYKADFTLNEGLKRMVNWAQNVGSRSSKKFINIEVQKNLPDLWLK
jgi:UDP-glucose 4-epimerase